MVLEICSTVEFTNNKGNMQIVGGTGRGKVTKPGLGLLLGHAAEKRVPMNMISEAVHEVLNLYPNLLEKHGLKITITVPNGEELAKKTDNPRLGYTGRNFNTGYNWYSTPLLNGFVCRCH